MSKLDTDTGEERKSELPAELTAAELREGCVLHHEARVVDLSDNRTLILELGGPENDVIIGREEPRSPDSIGGPMHDVRKGTPFVYIGEGAERTTTPAIEIPCTHLLPLGRDYQGDRFSEATERIHAMIKRRGNLVVIEDLGSKNGTTVRYQDKEDKD